MFISLRSINYLINHCDGELCALMKSCTKVLSILAFLLRLLNKWLTQFESYQVHISFQASACLIHWGWVTHICISNLTIIGSDNALSPCWRQAIIWAIAGVLLIGPLGTNFSEISNRNLYIFIQGNGFENIVCKMPSILSLPQCVNSLRPGDAIWWGTSHHWFSWWLVWLLSAKLFPEPTLDLLSTGPYQ